MRGAIPLFFSSSTADESGRLRGPWEWKRSGVTLMLTALKRGNRTGGCHLSPLPRCVWQGSLEWI